MTEKFDTGAIREICIARKRRGPMEHVQRAQALKGFGLQGDRYATGDGSYQFGFAGKRQMTLMHQRAFDLVRALYKVEYRFIHTRRTVLVDGDSIEPAWLEAKRVEFWLCDAKVRAVGYCDPCDVPTQQAGFPMNVSFKRLFRDLGGIILEVVEPGDIWVGGAIKTPDRGY